MERVESFLANLSGMQIKVWSQNGSLKLKAPKDVLTAALRDRIRSRKDEILQFLEPTHTNVETQTGPAPLSFSQAGCWFLETLNPGAPTWHIPISFRIHGELNLDHLTAALADLVRRHQILRSKIQLTDHQPTLVVDDTAAPTINLIHYPDNPSQFLDQQAKRPFDLTVGPMLRIHLIRCSEREWLLHVVFHHLITDGWSCGLFFNEWSRGYNARQRGESTIQPPAPLQFADVARRQQAEANHASRERRWWRNYLDGAPQVLELPLRATRPKQHNHQGSHSQSVLSATTWAKLTARHPPFVVLRALLTVLLGRWCGQEDFLLATVSAGRNHVDHEGLIGYFANTLAVRCKLTPQTTFSQILAAAQAEAPQLLDHGELPFELVVSDQNPVREPGRQPLVQVEFVFQNLPLKTPEWDGLELEPLPETNRFVRYDLEFQFREINGELHCHLTHAKALFDDSFGQRINAAFTTLAQAAAQNPNAATRYLPIMDPSTREQVLRHWNQTDQPHAGDLMGELRRFADPNKTAVIEVDGINLSHARLRQLALAGAAQLQAAGVQPDDRIGLLLPPSCELITAILAVLEAGACYLPLDPNYPQDRLNHMVDDAKLKLVLAQERPSWLPKEVQHIRLTDQAHPMVAVTPPPSSGAYMIYTSGSTGKPKGVVVSRGALFNTMSNVRQKPGFGRDDVLLAVTTPSFDNAVIDFITPLFNDATLVLANAAATLDGARMARAINQHKVTFLSGTPASWQLLLESAAPFNPKLRAASSGEVLPRGIAAQLLEQTALLHNQYGPTETAVWASGLKLTAANLDGELSIGQPMGNVKILILDPNLEPLPPHVSGQLMIGGAGLARGYFGKPALTAMRFIPNPHSSQPGARLYCSGDRAAWGSNGSIRFQGRLDRQIKLRGFRIEPGEIEAALCAIPSVREAVVCLRNQPVALAAFITPSNGHDPAHLKQILAKTLPNHMIPSTFTFLEQLPRTPAGKLDYNALINLPKSSPPPRTRPTRNVETALIQIWADNLGLETDQLDTQANFFDLGGHSLLVATVIGRINRQLNLKLEAVDMFTKPTIQALADFISHKQDKPEQIAPQGAEQPSQSRAVAVIGMAGRFPDAPQINDFAANLERGHEAVTHFGPPPPTPNADTDSFPVHANTILADYDCFDAAFFEISPHDAAAMDPQHRLFMETAWHAMEDAAHAPGAANPVGLFVGVGPNKYLTHNLAGHAMQSGDPAALHGGTGNAKDFLATRTAYKLNLQGPVMAVQTGCSSSTAALHMAVTSILDGSCQAALVGGVSLEVPHANGYIYQAGGILSPDGHCRSFDADAAGTVEGSAVAAIVIKPLQRAQQDGDQIHAVIPATAMNNDGSAKLGFTAAGMTGQTKVTTACLRLAGITADQLGYVVANGTATPMGDAMEIRALCDGLGQTTGPIAIGATKAAIGHGGAASGICSLIQAILAVKRGVIPPIVNFTRLNPDIEPGPLIFPSAPMDWPQKTGPRRAGVASFGIGGTNTYTLVEQAPKPSPAKSSAGCLLIWSATSDDARTRLTQKLANHFSHNPTPPHQAAQTLALGRAQLPYRAALYVDLDNPNFNEVRLGTLQRKRLHLYFPTKVAPSAQITNPAFKKILADLAVHSKAATARLSGFDQSLKQLCKQHGLRWKRVPNFDPSSCFEGDTQDQLTLQMLKREALALPVAALAMMATAQFWRDMGFTPDKISGSGCGAYTAAWFEGALSPEDVLVLAGAHGRLRQLLPGADGCLNPDSALAAEVGTLFDTLATPLNSQCFDSAAARMRLFHDPVPDSNPNELLCQVPPPAQEPFLQATATLWLQGVSLDWSPLFPQPHRVSLPGYPFKRQRHWIDPVETAEAGSMTGPLAARLQSRGLRAAGASETQLDRWIEAGLAAGVLEQAPQPDRAIVDREQIQPDPPQGEVETRIAEWWRECLGVEPIGRRESFFQLGGNSLIGHRILTRINQNYHLKLGLKALYEHHSIADQARLVNTLAKHQPREEGEI